MINLIQTENKKLKYIITDINDKELLKRISGKLSLDTCFVSMGLLRFSVVYGVETRAQKMLSKYYL